MMRALAVFCLVLPLAACGFDRARWASGRGVDASDNPRENMVCDAVAAGVAPGTTRARIRYLLGAPDGASPETDRYNVGLEFTSPDEVGLSIVYNSEDVVDRVALRHDWGYEVLRLQVPGTCGGNWGFQIER